MTSPVIVAGMHRSGTSLIASYLATLGIDMGRRFRAPDPANRHGYFEDPEFVALARRILLDCTPEGDGGHRDWGWTEHERFDTGPWENHRQPAQALIAQRARLEGAWGWKDPRTTVLLDFWAELLPAARWVLLYRLPWDVADSMQRLGAEVFLDHPDYAYRIWTFYNRRLLDFQRRHPGSCLLVSTDAVLRSPERFAALLTDRFGLAADSAAFAARRDPGIFASLPSADPLIGLVAATTPEVMEVLSALEDRADLGCQGQWPSGRHRLAANGATSGALPSPPRLSVVIPCYDQGELLLEAIASVERSAPEVGELVVVNDGSTEPRTLAVLHGLRGAGYRVIDQENAGLAAARNAGIRLSHGRYLLPLDADNRLHPGFTAEALAVMEASVITGVVYGDRLEFGLRHGPVEVRDFDLGALLRGNYIDACAVFRRRVWEDCGGYDTELASWEDWELWIAAAERGWRFHHLPRVAFEYRVRHGSMLSRTEHDRELGTRLQAHILAKHRDFYLRHLAELWLATSYEATLVRDAQLATALERQHLLAERANLDAEGRDLGERRGVQDIELAARARGLAEMQLDLERARAEIARLEMERGRLAAEVQRLGHEELLLRDALARGQERVAAMEAMSTWHWLQRLLRLRGE